MELDEVGMLLITQGINLSTLTPIKKKKTTINFDLYTNINIDPFVYRLEILHPCEDTIIRSTTISQTYYLIN